MKKILSALLACFLLLSTLGCLLVAAETMSADIKMQVSEGTYIVGDELTVRFTVVNIQSEMGIALAEFKINYDSSLLQYVSAETSVPTGWDFSDENNAESLSQLSQEGQYYFCLMTVKAGQPVKEDNQLYVDITFKILKESANASFTLTEIDFLDDAMNDWYNQDQKFTVSLNGVQDNDSSETAVSDTSDSSEAEEDSYTSGEVEYSDLSSSDNSQSEYSSDKDLEDGTDKTLKIVIVIAVVAVLAIVSVIIVLVSKRKKKS